jgi:hypothetical protein
MPKLTSQYRLEGIDLDQFPAEVALKHEKDGEREWWEWAEGKGTNRKAIVIQRPNQKLSWLIFFDQGERTRTLELPVPEPDKARGVVAINYHTFNLADAIKVLSDLGIKANYDNLRAIV